MTDLLSRTSAWGEPSDHESEEAVYYHEAGLYAAWTGSRLLIGALAFLFGGFAFAYFYLRSLNSHGMWKPSGFHSPSAWQGATIMGLLVVSAALQSGAMLRLKRGATAASWRLTAILSLVLGLAAVGLIFYMLFSVKFYPGSAGFASVFTGYFPVYAVVALAALVQMEILIAKCYRLPVTDFTARPTVDAEAMTVQRWQASLSGFTSVWNALAVVAVIAWILFFLA